MSEAASAMQGPATKGFGSVSGQANAPLDATAQFLTFQPGMYAVDFHATRSTPTNVGLALPCARLDAMPPSLSLPGRAVISLMSDGGWLFDGDPPAFIRVAGDIAGVLLTIYKGAGGLPSPELRIRYIRDDLQFQRVPLAADAPPAPQMPSAIPAPPTPAPPPPAAPTGPKPAAPGPDLGLAEGAMALEVLVHAQERGDLAVGAGAWAGLPGSQKLLEGFAVTVTDPMAELGPEALEYQAILGDGWNTPWFAAGEFCGSRGLALPILGLRMRLTGDAAERYGCIYWGSFLGAGEIGPIADGEACEADGQPMDALRVSILRRAPPTAPQMPPPPDPPPDLPPDAPPDAPASPSLGPPPGPAPPAPPERRRRRPRD